jgi:hypothetical protein
LNRKEVFGIAIVVAFVFLLARSQTHVQNDPAAVSCPSGLNPHVSVPSEDSTAAQGTPTFVDDLALQTVAVMKQLTTGQKYTELMMMPTVKQPGKHRILHLLLRDVVAM